jgi:UDP-glucuronate 4-epimerase
VVAVDNFDPFYDRATKLGNVRDLRGAAFELIEADIRDGAMGAIVERARPDAIIHLAALAGVTPSLLAPQRYVSVNVDGLASVLEAARASGCSRIVFASSSSVYGNNDKVPFAESDPVEEPISPYAATKRAGELLCHTYSHLFGLTIAALRYFTVFGPAQRPDLAIADFMRRIAAGAEVTLFGDGRSSRDYTYIDDIVTGTIAAERWTAAQPRPITRIFNLGGARPVALDDLVQAIGRVVGREPRVRRAPARAGDVARTWADLTRSSAELGYAPRVGLEEGLARQWQETRSRRDEETK